MAREHRVHQLRHDRFVVADDAGKQCLAGLQLARRGCREFPASPVASDSRTCRRSPRVCNGRHGSILSELDWLPTLDSSTVDDHVFLLLLAAPSRLRAPRRQRARAGEHASRRSTTVWRLRRRRPRARRASVARRRRRRSSRRHPRPHHDPARPDFAVDARMSSRRQACPTLADVLARYRAHADHRRAQAERSDLRVPKSLTSCERTRRSIAFVSDPSARSPPSGARARAANRDQRLAGGSQVVVVSIVVTLAQA